MLTSTLAFLAAAWGVLMACAPALQMLRMWRARSSVGVSLAYFGVLLPGFGLWLAYGLASANLALVVPNAVALLVHGATVTLAYRLRPGTVSEHSSRKRRPHRAAGTGVRDDP